jgi:nucleoside 2-deoxyribosyltransferase
MKTVYLAGPISGLTFDGAQDWRTSAETFLASRGVRGLSPLRGKEYLRALGELSPQCGAEGKAGTLSLPRSIMTRDFYDATRCDVLLVNLLGATRVSIGTVMEIAWGYQVRTPVVLAMEPGNVHEHAMIAEAYGYRVSTLEEALAISCSILAV